MRRQHLHPFAILDTKCQPLIAVLCLTVQDYNYTKALGVTMQYVEEDVLIGFFGAMPKDRDESIGLLGFSIYLDKMELLISFSEIEKWVQAKVFGENKCIIEFSSDGLIGTRLKDHNQLVFCFDESKFTSLLTIDIDNLPLLRWHNQDVATFRS